MPAYTMHSLHHDSGFITVKTYHHKLQYIGDESRDISFKCINVRTFPINDLPAFMLENRITEFHSDDDLSMSMSLTNQQIDAESSR